jgi:hypothetical protein
MTKYASSPRRMCASSYEYVSNMTDTSGTLPSSSNESNRLAFQEIPQALSVQSLNPPVTQTRAAHFSLTYSTQESESLK